MSAIEVLKKTKAELEVLQWKFISEETNKDFRKALDSALLALEQKEKIKKSLLTIKKLLKRDIDDIGNLNVNKNRNKLWFLTGELNIIENILELFK